MSLPIAIDRPLVIFDIESTSSNAKQARIVEIAMERWTPDGQMTSYATLINPEVPIPAEATAVHGITDAMVADAPTWRQKGPQVMRAFLGDWGVADLCGYNLKYDREVLRTENKRCGVRDEVPEGVTPPRSLDPLRCWQHLEPRSLSDAMKRWSPTVSFDGAHRAGADVTATHLVLEGILSEKIYRNKTLAEICALVDPVDPNAATADGKLRFVAGGVAFNQGAHKGVILRDVPVGYLSWALREDFSKDSKALIEQELKFRRTA